MNRFFSRSPSGPLAAHAGRRVALIGLLACASLLGACGTTTRLDPAAPVEDKGSGARATAAAPGSGSGLNGANGLNGGTLSPLPESKVGTLDLGANKANADRSGRAASAKTVYFGYDSYVVRDQDRNVIEANASYLAGDRKRQLLIEGHTDERGGREYNLALGQKRADSVVRALVLLGAADSQLEAVSYGKERPAASGGDEAAFAKNRRAELKDR
ncbi:MAG: peptidoglycan-associated lipoprotein Pal [Leptothrix sp. (in: b-proteobacteria)]